MEVVLASGNAHKIKEIKEILSPLGIVITTLSENGYPDLDIEETGSTFSENSKINQKLIGKIGTFTNTVQGASHCDKHTIT